MPVRPVVKAAKPMKKDNNKKPRGTVSVNVTKCDTATDVAPPMFDASKSEMDFWGVVPSKTYTSNNLNNKSDSGKRTKTSKVRQIHRSRVTINMVTNSSKKRVAYRSYINRHEGEIRW